MKAASIAELKKALVRLEHGELLEACLRLVRFKKDNKELLTYLLFMAHDEQAFAEYLCSEIDEHFLNKPSLHKKTVRSIIRWTNKVLRFTKVNDTEVQVRLHFCRRLRDSETPLRRSRVLFNMYQGQLKKVSKIIEKMHDDVRREIETEISELRIS